MRHNPTRLLPMLLLGALVAGAVVVAPWEARVSSIAVPQPVELRVLTARPNDPAFAVVDLDAATVESYPRPAHRMGGDAVGGAVVTPGRGDTVIWSQGVARLFTGGLDAVDAVLRPDPLRRVPEIAPALRVVPAPDGETAWLVQPGQECCGHSYPTLVEQVELPSGRTTMTREIARDAFPMAATDEGLVLGSERLVDSGEGWVTAPGSERVLHLAADGTLVDIGHGRPVAASGSAVARLDCPPAGREDAVAGPQDPGCELRVSDIDGGRDRRVDAPSGGEWIDVGGPQVPGDSVPLRTVSPDGRELLVARGTYPRGDGEPASSVLLAVDLARGTTREIASFHGSVPLATWSRDGRWVVVFEGRDIRAVDAADPAAPAVLLPGAVPAAHFVLAAG